VAIARKMPRKRLGHWDLMISVEGGAIWARYSLLLTMPGAESSAVFGKPVFGRLLSMGLV